MQLSQTILVPTDFSEASELAIEAARILALQNEATVILVHVFDPVPLAPIATRNVTAVGQQQLEADLESSIHEALDALRREKLAEVKTVRTELLLGSNPANVICDFAKKEDVDLIAVSTHGRTGLSHLLIGSVAERIVRHAICPVLTLRSKAKA